MLFHSTEDQWWKKKLEGSDSSLFLASFLLRWVCTEHTYRKAPKLQVRGKVHFLESRNRAIKNNPGPQKPSPAPLGVRAPSPRMGSAFFVSEAQRCLLVTQGLVCLPAGDAATGACLFGSPGPAHPEQSPLFHSAAQGHSGYSVVLEKMKIQVWDESRPSKNREDTPEIWNKLATLLYIFFLCHINGEKRGPKGHGHPVFIAAPFTVTRTWRPARRPRTEERVKGCSPAYMVDCYVAAGKTETMACAATWAGLENIREREIRCGMLTREIQTNGTKELICKTEQTHRHRDKTNRHRHREWTHGSQQGRVGGMHRSGVWEDMYTLVYFTWITTKDKLYSAGNTALDSITA